jgi:biopolymer transport protein TolR
MKRRRSSRQQPALRHEINVTPFVDVMLVLLIIFMVSAPMMQVSVPVNLPQGGSGTSTEVDDPIIVTIDEQEKLFLKDTAIDQSQLLTHLASLPSGSASKIYLRGARSIPYNAVIKIMNVLKSAGFSQIHLVVEHINEGEKK